MAFFRHRQKEATNSNGGMFKVGVLVVNGRAMLKAKEKLDKINKEANEKKQQKIRRSQKRKSRQQLFLSVGE